MSKPAIDELLDTVSGCDMDDPRFGARYGGDMDDEEFLQEVDEYVLELQAENEASCRPKMKRCVMH